MHSGPRANLPAAGRAPDAATTPATHRAAEFLSTATSGFPATQSPAVQISSSGTHEEAGICFQAVRD